MACTQSDISLLHTSRSGSRKRIKTKKTEKRRSAHPENELWPPGLEEVYHAVAFSTFSGYPEDYNGETRTKEEVALITHERICQISEEPLDEPGPDEPRSDEPSCFPISENTVIFGGFTNAQDALDVIGRIRARLGPYLISVEERFSHTVLLHYVLVSIGGGHASSLTRYFRDNGLSDHVVQLKDIREAYVIDLPKSLAHKLITRVALPIIVSTCPTSVIQVINLRAEKEKVEEYLLDYNGVVEVCMHRCTCTIRTAGPEYAERIYRALCGRTINGHHVFVMYYPEALQDILIQRKFN